MIINRKVKQVPAGIRYLGEWPDFALTNFQGHNILHKQIPGCGFTEFALTCPEPVVLCSPRKMLMENKKEQHGDDVYLVVNQYEVERDIDVDVSKPEPNSTIHLKDLVYMEREEELTRNFDTLYSKLFHEIGDYITRRAQQKLPPKIIVTYDSSYIAKRVLTQMGIINQFWFCVDEMQSVLDDARFKADTELEFLTILRDIKNVLFVSATPMIDEYLVQIDELSTLPYYQLDWATLDPSRVTQPKLETRVVSSTTSKICEIIQSYLNGEFEKVVVWKGGKFEEIYSFEGLFFVNCVDIILSTIKKMKLQPDQVNILCSNTPANQKKIDKKLGKKSGFKIGKVPLPGEPHKMFTFCTRTVYLGADFYSTCARSFIFSDSNADCLAVDISMDLAQILGRIRLDENPWKNSAMFFYRTTADYKKMSRDELESKIAKKVENSNNLLMAYNSTPETAKNTLAEMYQRDVKREKYRDNFIGVNKKEGNSLQPSFNKLVLINDYRAFDIQQVDYADRFSVFTSINREFGSVGIKQEEVTMFFDEYDKLKTWVDKIRFIVDYLLSRPDMRESIIANLVDSDKIKQQLLVLGPEKIRGWGYNLTKINKAMGITIFDKSTFLKEIEKEFIPGQKYTNKDIKAKLGAIYKAADYKGTAKATDLEEWFVVESTQIADSGKRLHGLKIISKKPQ